MLTVGTIISIIEMGTRLIKSVTGIVEATKETLSSDDVVKIDTALAQLQKENDALFNAVDAKLSAAAKDTD